jgi:hypothetical protein
LNKKNWIAALAACMVLPASAQSLGYTPTSESARQARDNAQRDARMADAMEQARLKEEAKPVAAYIPKQESSRPTPALKSPEIFTARIPGPGKKAAEKPKTEKSAKQAPKQDRKKKPV